MRDVNRRRLLLGVAAVHLTLAALGAGSVRLRPFGPLGRLLDDYSNLSGADTSYGFFSPGVEGQARGSFDVIDGEGQTSTISLEAGATREADLRISNIINQVGNDDPLLRRAFAASLAGKVFARYPNARNVVVRLDWLEPVSMEEFRGGSRPQWTQLYQAKFAHRERPATESR